MTKDLFDYFEVTEGDIVTITYGGQVYRLWDVDTVNYRIDKTKPFIALIGGNSYPTRVVDLMPDTTIEVSSNVGVFGYRYNLTREIDRNGDEHKWQIHGSIWHVSQRRLEVWLYVYVQDSTREAEINWSSSGGNTSEAYDYASTIFQAQHIAKRIIQNWVK